MRNRIRYLYMESITGQNRKVTTFKELARLLNDVGIKAVFYVTPVNYQLYGRYVGPEFVAQLRRNVAVVKKAVESHGYPVMDLSEALPTDGFIPEEAANPSEHMAYKGRELVAKCLAERIRAINRPEADRP